MPLAGAVTVDRRVPKGPARHSAYSYLYCGIFALVGRKYPRRFICWPHPPGAAAPTAVAWAAQLESLSLLNGPASPHDGMPTISAPPSAHSSKTPRRTPRRRPQAGLGLAGAQCAGGALGHIRPPARMFRVAVPLPTRI
jgi:hypothetical protein